MILYLVKSALCMIILLGVYHLLLGKERMFRFNRFYLLGSLIAALLIPLMVVSTNVVEVESIKSQIESATSQQSESDLLNSIIINENPVEINWFAVIWGVGFLILLIRFSILLNYFLS